VPWWAGFFAAVVAFLMFLCDVEQKMRFSLALSLQKM